MKFRMSLLATALLLVLAPLSRAQVNCNAQIIDQTGQIRNPQVITAASRTLINQGADVHVVIVDSIQRYGSSLADVERNFEQSCPSWMSNGVRKANLFVVMVAPNDRAKNIFLGSYYNGAFDITSTYSALSNSYFKNRQWELGVAAVLNGTTGQALAFHQRTFNAQQQQRAAVPPPARTYTYPTTPTQSSSGGSGLLIFLIVLLVLGGIGTLLYFLFRNRDTDSSSTSTTSTDPGYTVSDPPYMHTPIPSIGASLRPSSPRTYAAAASAPAPVQHTTIINNDNSGGGNGLLTGVLLGEALSRPSYTPPPVYVQPSPVYTDPTPSYVPDPPAATQDAPDSSWEEPAAAQPDTSFSQPDPEPEAPSYEAPSDSSFGGGDSSFGGDSGGSSGDSGF